MLLILYSSLLSYMLFFTICVAPVSNKILNESNLSLIAADDLADAAKKAVAAAKGEEA